MLNFDFYNPTRILFGKDGLEGIDKYVPAEATVLITYGGGSGEKAISYRLFIACFFGDGSILSCAGI
jgi:alcohol dehydrogenase YqhD (iron-dependent ADH family)